jgi:hypothetical protein
MSFIPGMNLTAVWRYPNSTIYSKESRVIPGLNYFETLWRDEVFYIKIAEDKPSQVTGKWTVELYHNDVFTSDYSFNIIDRSGPDWDYSASILSVESPESVRQNQNFSVSIEVYYNFGNMTTLTPGLWDPETGNLFNEVNDTLMGEGIKTYEIEMAMYDFSGPYTIDAVVFYLMDNEWFLDDEGIMSFDIVIEEQGQSTLIYVGALVLVVLLAVVFLRKRIQPV